MLYEQLERHGHAPSIICRRGYALEAHARRRGWRHLALAFNSRFHPARDAHDVKLWLDWVYRHEVDVLHCHRGKDHWVGMAVAQWTRRPIVRTRHVVQPVRQHLLNRWLYLSATDAVLCVSEAVRESFLSWAPRLPRGAVIHSPVDVDRFHPAKADPRWRIPPGDPPQGRGAGAAFWAIWVGRLQGIKGPDVMIEAALRTARQAPRFHLMMIGVGSVGRVHAIRQRVADAGLADRIRIVNAFVDDLPARMAAMDAGVITSVGSEGSSRVALEMMASGLPLVASRVGGIPEIVGKQPGNRLVRPGDAAAVSQAIQHLMGDPREAHRIGQANRVRVERDHRPDNWCRQMIATYASVLGVQPETLI